jgi:hypothetical protein
LQLVTHVSVTLKRFSAYSDPKIVAAAAIANAKSPTTEFGIAGFDGPGRHGRATAPTVSTVRAIRFLGEAID